MARVTIKKVKCAVGVRVVRTFDRLDNWSCFKGCRTNGLKGRPEGGKIKFKTDSNENRRKSNVFGPIFRRECKKKPRGERLGLSSKQYFSKNTLGRDKHKVRFICGYTGGKSLTRPKERGPT